MKTLLLAVILLLPFAAPSQAANNPDGVAVIVGNKNYASSVPTVDYAHNDAKAIRQYVVDVLGFREGNIIDLRDATQTQLLSVFGNERTHEGTIWQYVRPNRSDVVVFYSGHGVPGQKDRRGYLLPVDANPDTPEINGYPIDLLYKNLSKIKARSTTVFLDTCFSGESAKGMLIRSASPIHIKAKMPSLTNGMTVITAAQGDQLASWDDKAQHGLFTEHLLEALYGKADIQGYGNGDGKVTLKEIKTYLDEEMTYAARRRFNRHQQATVLGDEESVLASYSPGNPLKRTKMAVQDDVSLDPQTAQQPVMSDASIAWQSVQNSTNIAEIEAFILSFRSSPFASMARARLQELKKQQVAVLTPSLPKLLSIPIEPNTPSPTTSSILPEGTVKERYSFAFGLLRNAEWEQAELALKEFINYHRNDPLSYNARYWLAESFYVRGQYVSAVEYFARGFQAAPSGSKAPDMLLKLGMSFSNLGKKIEACTFFSKILRDFPRAKNRVLSKMRFESKKNSCPSTLTKNSKNYKLENKKEWNASLENALSEALKNKNTISPPLTLSEVDHVRKQIAQCWNLPAGTRDAENAKIEIAVTMNKDGSVWNAKINNKGLRDRPHLRAMAESALRAVLNRRCQPFNLPSEKYGRWKTMTLIFDPKEMF